MKVRKLAPNIPMHPPPSGRQSDALGADEPRSSVDSDLMIGVYGDSQRGDYFVFDCLKRIEAEQTAARDRDQEILSRLARIESGLARVTRDESSNNAEMVEGRHTVDKLRERIERLERLFERP